MMADGGIRRATPNEAGELAELYLRCRRAAVPAIPPVVHPDDDVHRWVRDEVIPNRDVWVWASNTRLLGLLVLNGIWLDQLYIDPDHLGEGLGTALLKHAQSLSPGGLQLWTFQSNLGARRFYERHGFVEGASTDGTTKKTRPMYLSLGCRHFNRSHRALDSVVLGPASVDRDNRGVNPVTITVQRLAVAGAALSMALVLAGCSPAGDSTDTDATSKSSETAPDDSPTDSPKEPVQQAASCEWDEPQLPASAAVAPSGTVGDLATVLIGSWQHTHFDSGEGFEALDEEDIRYVFPSTEQLIYCQHVPGVTDHAENTAAFTLEGSTILPPSPHTGFEVLAWSDDTMLWQNNLDDSTYLLVRR